MQLASEYSKLIINEKFEKFQFLIFPGHPQLFLRQVTSIPVLITLVVVVEGAVIADSVVHVDHVGVLAVGLDNGWREKDPQVLVPMVFFTQAQLSSQSCTLWSRRDSPVFRILNSPFRSADFNVEVFSSERETSHPVKRLGSSPEC